MSPHHKKTALITTSLRLLCTDFDGTLADGEGSPISPAFFERLAAWRQRGRSIGSSTPDARSTACMTN